MIDSTDELDAAIASRVRTPMHVVQVDFDRDGYSGTDDLSGYVTDIEIDRSIQSDLPDGTRIVAGYESAQATINLMGEKTDADHHGAWVFSATNTDSTYYGKKRVQAPTQVQIGFDTTSGPETLTRFAGSIREFDVDAGERTAQIQALDDRLSLHSLVTIPMVANGYIPSATQDSSLSADPLGVRPGLDGQWPMDYTLRQAGFYASPAPRTSCVLSATMHGSAAPEVGDLSFAYFANQFLDSSGTLVDPDGDRLTFDQGNFAEALQPRSLGFSGGAVCRWTTSDMVPLIRSSAFIVECWVDTTAPTNATRGGTLVSGAPMFSIQTTTTDSILVGVDGSRRPYLQCAVEGAVDYASAISAGWHYLKWTVSINSAGTGISAVVAVDGNSTYDTLSATRSSALPSTRTGVTTKVTLAGRFPSTSTKEDYGCAIGIEALQVTNESSGPSNYSFTPSASLEASKNPISVVPYSETGTDAWTLIQDIATAEFGVALFDETGTFKFWNRDHFGVGQSVDYDAGTVTVNGVTSPIPQVTSRKAIKALATSETVDSIRNHILVHYNPYSISAADWVWQASDKIRIGTRATKTITATLDNPAVGIVKEFVWIDHGSSTGGFSGYRACRRITGLGEPVDNLVFSVSVTAQTATITITNPNPYWCYLVSPQADSSGAPYSDSVVGEPRLWLRGMAVVDTSDDTSTTTGSTGAAAEYVDDASKDAYGDQVYEADSGGWVQTEESASACAKAMLKVLKRPNPVLQNVTVVGDPRLQLGDRIELVDETGSALSEHAWIVGITETFSSGSYYEQSLTLRFANAIGGWVLGHPTRSVLGSTTVLGGVY